MFKSKRNIPEKSKRLPQPTETNKETLNIIEHQKNTIIGVDVYVKGTLNASDNVYIHGKITGDILVEEGVVKVMNGGIVQGNITCHHLISDGSISGECTAEHIEIAENGFIDGMLTYKTISVKKGGVFCGGAKNMKEQDTGNVTSLILTRDEVYSSMHDSEEQVI